MQIGVDFFPTFDILYTTDKEKDGNRSGDVFIRLLPLGVYKAI